MSLSDYNSGGNNKKNNSITLYSNYNMTNLVSEVDATHYTLPAVTAFERCHFVDYQPVQGEIEILNPCSLLKK